MRAVDYSFARPDPASIKAAGYDVVLRYIAGGSANKLLTATEAAKLHAAGLSIALVYESTADRAAAGRAAGVHDASTALTAANALGYPAACPIFFAVDFAATPAQVAAYFAGVDSVLGPRAGIYGDYAVTTAGLAAYRWQTKAWSSHGQVDTGAHLVQQLAMSHPIPECDEDTIQHPFPTWGPSSKPAPRPSSRTPGQALAVIRTLARARVDIGAGRCLENAHNVYGIPTNGTRSAALAWDAATHKHGMDVEPTIGSFVFYTGGHTIVAGKPAGHVVIYAGRGRIRRRTHWAWSPGAPGPGNAARWVKVRLRDIPAGWPGHVLAGWSEDIDGVRVHGLAPRSSS